MKAGGFKKAIEIGSKKMAFCISKIAPKRRKR